MGGTMLAANPTLSVCARMCVCVCVCVPGVETAPPDVSFLGKSSGLP